MDQATPPSFHHRRQHGARDADRAGEIDLEDPLQEVVVGLQEGFELVPSDTVPPLGSLLSWVEQPADTSKTTARIAITAFDSLTGLMLIGLSC